MSPFCAACEARGKNRGCEDCIGPEVLCRRVVAGVCDDGETLHGCAEHGGAFGENDSWTGACPE